MSLRVCLTSAGLLLVTSVTLAAEPYNPRARRPSDFTYQNLVQPKYEEADVRSISNPPWAHGRGVEDVEIFLDEGDRVMIRFTTPERTITRPLARGRYVGLSSTRDGLTLTPRASGFLNRLVSRTTISDVTIENDPAAPRVLAAVVVGTALLGRVLFESWVPGVAAGGTVACGLYLASAALGDALPFDHWIVSTKR